MTLAHVELDPKQDKLWTDTRAMLMFWHPAFTHILLTMLQKGKRKQQAVFTTDKDVPIAATDGSALILNPTTFFTFTLPQRIFIVAHEILHCVLNHMILAYGFQKRGKVSYPDGKDIPYNHEIMNIALDLVINAILIESKIGEMPTKNGVQVGHWDTSIATHMDSGIDIYRKIYKECKKKGRGTIPGANGKGGSFDKHLKPGTGDGKDPQTAANDRNEGEWKGAIEAAATLARAMGKLPAGLDRVFGEVLQPKVDWREHIKGLLARKVGSGSNDWRRPNRQLIVRDIYAPGRSGHGAGIVVVGGDTSGSVTNEEEDMFFAEMAGMLEDIRPTRLIILWCDAKVQRVDEAEEMSDLMVIRHKGAPGRGGTDFRPVFDWIAEQHITPDALVYLTDGMGSFPQRSPEYPVIWGSVLKEPQDYPFGDVVMIPRSDESS